MRTEDTNRIAGNGKQVKGPTVKATDKADGYVFTEIPSPSGGMLLKIAREVYMGNSDGIPKAIEISIGDGNVQVFEQKQVEKGGFNRIVREFAVWKGWMKH